jgi:energy-coupling factor transport system substrate-specific component
MKTSEKIREVAFPMTYVAAMVPVAAAINIVGGTIANVLHLPIFLDMIGTCVAAITIGPWWASIAGLITNMALSFVRPTILPFAACNVGGALVWGFGVMYGWGKTWPRFLALSIIANFVVSAIAQPIVIFIFGGATGHFSDIVTAALLAMGWSLWAQLFGPGQLAGYADKILAAFLALAILEALPPELKIWVPITKAPPMRRVMYIVVGLIVAGFVALAYYAWLWYFVPH